MEISEFRITKLTIIEGSTRRTVDDLSEVDPFWFEVAKVVVETTLFPAVEEALAA